MQPTPPRDSGDDLRLSQDEIRARLDQVRQNSGVGDPGIAGQVAGTAFSAGTSVLGGLLGLLRIPLLIVGAIGGYLVANQLASNVLIGLVGAVIGFVVVGSVMRAVRNRLAFARLRSDLR